MHGHDGRQTREAERSQQVRPGRRVLGAALGHVVQQRGRFQNVEIHPGPTIVERPSHGHGDLGHAANVPQQRRARAVQFQQRQRLLGRWNVLPGQEAFGLGLGPVPHGEKNPRVGHGNALCRQAMQRVGKARPVRSGENGPGGFGAQQKWDSRRAAKGRRQNQGRAIVGLRSQDRDRGWAHEGVFCRQKEDGVGVRRGGQDVRWLRQ